jgi:dienelactone hydrolase
MTDLHEVAFHHDGADLVGVIAVPQTPGPHPAVMVMHNAHGLGEFVRDKARQLAKLGYVAVATDMYGGGTYHTDPTTAGPSVAELLNNPKKMRSRAAAWCAQLKARPDVDPQRVAAIGYCFGGMCVLELARSGADLKAFVSYHGLLDTSLPAESGAVKGQVAVYTGAKDPYVPAAHVEALSREFTAAGAHLQVTVFGDAFHAFTDPNADGMGRPGIAYDELAARVSWAGTLALLEAVL